MNTVFRHKKIVISTIALFPFFPHIAVAQSTNSYGGQYTYTSSSSGTITVNNNNTINIEGVLTPPSSDDEFFSAKIKAESSATGTNAIMGNGSLSSTAGEMNIANNSVLNGNVTGASNTVKNSATTGNGGRPIYTYASAISLSANGQQLNISDSTINGNVTGAKNESIGLLSSSLGGVYASNSQVEFSANSGDMDIKNSSITGNLVGATNRSVTDQAYSGLSLLYDSQSNFIAASGLLTIDNSKVAGNVVGASNYIEGYSNGLSQQTGSDSNFHAIGGNLIINQSVVNGDIIGTQNSFVAVNVGIAISDSQSTIAATGGLITLADSTTGSIYGARNDIISTNNGTAISIGGTANLNIQATNSTVNISGNSVLRNVNSSGNTTYDAELWGGYINIQGTIQGTGQGNIYRDSFTDNTLNFSASPITVAKMGNFENYNFSLNDSNKNLINTSTGLITVTDTLQNNDTIRDTGTIHNVSNAKLTGISGTVDIKNGDSIILIDTTDATINGGDSSQTGVAQVINAGSKETIKVGLIKDVDVEYAFAGNNNEQLVATIIDANDGSGGGNGDGGVGTVNNDYLKQLKALSESRLASLMAVNRGADLVSNAIDNLAQQTLHTFTPFFIMQTGYDRYNSGSHIESNTTSIVVGSSYQLNEHFALGALYEYGNGSYDTYNSFNTGKVKGSGNTHYYGAGLIAKYTEDNTYIDGSILYGRSKTNYNNHDIITGGGSQLKYNHTSDYWSGHIGGGFTYAINKQNTLDTSLKYLVTQLDGFNTQVEGSRIKFNNATSSRLQLGEKLTHQLNDVISIRGGLTYEYEFNGRPQVKVDGYNIDKASVRGSTGILELGVNLKPIQKIDKLELDFATRGYVGKHEGVSGVATIRYTF